MIQQWAKRALALMTMILKSDSAVREFTGEERAVLHQAHGILSRHQPGTQGATEVDLDSIDFDEYPSHRAMRAAYEASRAEDLGEPWAIGQLEQVLEMIKEPCREDDREEARLQLENVIRNLRHDLRASVNPGTRQAGTA